MLYFTPCLVLLQIFQPIYSVRYAGSDRAAGKAVLAVNLLSLQKYFYLNKIRIKIRHELPILAGQWLYRPDGSLLRAFNCNCYNKRFRKLLGRQSLVFDRLGTEICYNRPGQRTQAMEDNTQHS